MNISFNWLKDYLKIDMGPEELSVLLTDCGLEVEGLSKVDSVKGGLEGILIGEVLSCEQHPNADKLSLTSVDVGSATPLKIVCGAPNVAKGQKVAVATVGAVLYSGDESFVIKKAKLRGEPSEGMICAEDELGLGDNHDGIMVLDQDAVPGSKASDYFKIESDYIYEIGLTPNRTDAISHYGVARDIAAVLNNMDVYKDYSQQQATLPDIGGFKIQRKDYTIPVEVQSPEACPRYSGVSMIGVSPDESPQWLKNRLKAIGVRPVNNLVDIGNFVMFETGQPLHIFDAGKIKGGKIIVKKLEENTPFTTLDGNDRKLSSEDLMICDGEENPMCIAGVFGGIDSGVNNLTKNIFIESAFFNPQSIRKTARRHGLQTDASFRFERTTDVSSTLYALKRAALLIQEIAGGEVSSDIIDVYPSVIKENTLTVRYEQIDKLIGKSIDRSRIKNIITSLGMKVTADNKDSLDLLIPLYKADVYREADLIEEVLRIYGYNNIELPQNLKSSPTVRSKPDLRMIREDIMNLLSHNGFTEIMNNSLCAEAHLDASSDFNKEQAVRILNPLSAELNIMRPSLLFGALDTAVYNINRKKTNLRLFEFGSTYLLDKNNNPDKETGKSYKESNHLALTMTGNTAPANWFMKDQEVGFYDLKFFVNSILERIGVQRWDISTDAGDVFNYGLVYSINEKEILRFGLVKKSILKKWDIPQSVFYAEINFSLLSEMIQKEDATFKDLPRFPEVRRDLSLLLPANVSFEDIHSLAVKTEKKLLKKVSLFDVYQGKGIEEGKKSYAISFTLQREDKTMTDKEIEKVMKRLMNAFSDVLKAEIR